MSKFTPEEEKKFARYEEIKIAIKNLEEEAEQLKPELLPLVPEGSEIEGEYGKFSIMKITKYSYSQDIRDQEDLLKQRKKDEVRMGVAEAVETITLKYSEKKQKDNGEI